MIAATHRGADGAAFPSLFEVSESRSDFVVVLPCGDVKGFTSCAAFDGYVKHWRLSGYPVAWPQGPRMAVITRGVSA